MSQAGRPLRYQMRVDVEGYIEGTGQADLTIKEAIFRQALLTPYGNLSLLQDSGATSAVALFNNTSLSGTRIVEGPSFEESQGPEYVTQRKVRFAMMAEYLAPGATGVLVKYMQSVTVIGTGGPVRVWRFPINAKPIRQIVKPYSLVTVIQRGEAVGHTSKPPAAPYLFSRDFLVNETASIEEATPRPMGRAWVEYPVRWNYIFHMTEVPTFQFTLPAM
jgi:hypothetical protein